MIRSFILILCLLGEVLVLSAKADIESSALSQGTEVFVQSIMDFDDVGNCEFLDTNENEEETEVFCENNLIKKPLENNKALFYKV